MSADLIFANIHNDDITKLESPVRSSVYISVNQETAAQREQDWLTERIAHEAGYQRKQADRAD